MHVSIRALTFLLCTTAVGAACDDSQPLVRPSDAGVEHEESPPEDFCKTYDECLQQWPDANQDLKKPVERPATGGIPGDDVNLQAVEVVHLGVPEYDPGGPTWSELGFDLDGVHSTKGWSFHCRVPKSAWSDVRTDGPGGVDNMFAKKVVPTAAGGGNAVQFTSANISRGLYSLVLEVDGAGAGASFTSLSAKLYSVRGLHDASGFIPVTDFATYPWNPKDAWSAGVTFTASYMNQDVWVSGDPHTFPVAIPFGNGVVDFALHSAVISARFSSDHQTTSEGIIAGAIRIEDIQVQFPTLFRDAGFCDYEKFFGANVDSFNEFKDIYLDDSDHIVLDPTKECNAISFAMGFSTVRSQLHDTVDPSLPPVCP